MYLYDSLSLKQLLTLKFNNYLGSINSYYLLYWLTLLKARIRYTTFKILTDLKTLGIIHYGY